MSSVDGNIYNTDVKFGESVQGYVGLIFSNLSRMVQTLSNPELGGISTNVYLIGQLIISHIPDPVKRKELRKILKERINELKKEKAPNGEKLPEESIKYINVLATTEIIGNVMDEIDTFCGIVKESKISFDLNCSACKYRVKSIELIPQEVGEIKCQ